MAKHLKEENEVLSVIESPDALINSIVKNKEDREWALNEILHGGPKHKQVYSALLLQRMHQLVQEVERQTGESFSAQKGTNLTSHKEEAEIPVPLVLSSLKKSHQKEVAEILSGAPAHEMIAFNTLLQAIEWSLIALTKSKQ